MSKALIGTRAYPRIRFSRRDGEVAALASRDLSSGLAAMLGREVAASMDASLDRAEIVIDLSADAESPRSTSSSLETDSFEISRQGGDLGSIAIRAGSSRGLIHAVADFLEKLGARFAPGVAPSYPHIDAERLRTIEPVRVTPAFKRRAFVSDLMTWNYSFPDRLELHLRHDREFIPWMARRGINAFSYIRHAHDTRLKIEELAPPLRERGIDAEYGGHILPLLLPRERFDDRPDFFPAGDDGVRIASGNLCVSNPDALAIVSQGALAYTREHPENKLLHIWGADVRGGAWCRCAQCRQLPPQLQYMKVVNAIAAELANDANAPPVAYLAYHDTIDPHAGLKPHKNVSFEWAPRERCYSHAIDDPDCEINPRYLDSLKRYFEIFDGRAHVFEYYADAILFCGLGFAIPSVIARDLRCYRSLGITSISCLTFGAYSAAAYPVSLEAFVRGSINPDFDPDDTFVDTAAGRHPQCSREMAASYRAIERASKLVLDYADVMRPFLPREKAARKRVELARAADTFNEAIAGA
ncbi:MAG TPA: DUF4838 domain-containing protein, partial [Methylomirabilota bacterium]|nr:DUF4838 domain-containing protein [Methylomirabilota bacterium]